MKSLVLSAIILASATASTFAAAIQGSTLTTATAATLTQNQCSTLVGPQNIPPAVVPALTNACIQVIGASFTNAQMNALRPDQISAAFDTWTDEQMRKLTPAQISGLPVSQASGLVSSFSSWNVLQIQALTPAQLAVIPDVFGYPWFPRVFEEFTNVQIASITDLAFLNLAKDSSSIQKVPARRISSLSIDITVALASAGHLKNLSVEQLNYLQPPAVRLLKNSDLLRGLDSAQLNALPPTNYFSLRATLDISCAAFAVDLDDVRARYTSQMTQPTPSPSDSTSANYTTVSLDRSGYFRVPDSTTFVYFLTNGDPYNTPRDFDGMYDTVFPVSEMGNYTLTCRPSNRKK